ncbi:MAG: substrate-binding domain-containing protein, partial [Thioalkalivibrio sp.]|nr:substrate-binding domain-containing protein [Thioalkalivibrio sp.]
MLGSFDARWGVQAADQLLDRRITSATLVVAADVIALGLLSRLQSRGHRVPDDFRVIGFDGVGVTALAHPELTTVRQPVEAMSRRILELVTSKSTEGDTQDIRIPPTLVIGASSPEG